MLSDSSSALPGKRRSGRMEESSFLKCQNTNFSENRSAGNRETCSVSERHDIEFFMSSFNVERDHFGSKERAVCFKSQERQTVGGAV